MFLYSMWNGRFMIYEGELTNVFSSDKYARFRAKNVHKIINLSSQEGVVYNAMVWLEKRNDEKARDILIDNSRRIIHDHELNIQNHLDRIERLQTEPELR